MLTYPGTITLPESTLDFLAGLLQADREQLGTWRKLPARDQALLVLAHLPNGDTSERRAASFKIGVATAYRYVHEAVTLLARRGRGLLAALGTLTWPYQQRRHPRRHAGAHQPDPRPRPAVLRRPAPPPRRQPARAHRPRRPADLDL